ncbi:MAG: GTPase HflX, partial [Hyphomicrobiaceae bacterium]|nr:GTPase HflX [Hyphomicrobiaceae bacterium]
MPESEKRRDDMRALVLVPVLKQAKAQPLPEGAPPAPSRSNEARLEEAIGLARAI